MTDDKLSDRPVASKVLLGAGAATIAIDLMFMLHPALLLPGVVSMVAGALLYPVPDGDSDE